METAVEDQSESSSAGAAAGLGGQALPPEEDQSGSGSSSDASVPERAAQGAATAQAASLPAAGNRGSGPQPDPAALPPVHKPGVFDQILTALGGGPNRQVSIDSASGRRVVTDTPPSRKQSLARIMAGALEGLFAGEQQHGPVAGLRSFAAGADATLQAGEQRNQNADQKAQQEFQRQQAMTREQQEAQLKAAQTMEANQRALLTSRQAENAAAETRQKYVESANPVIAAARGEEVNGTGALKREHLTQAQLLAEHAQEGARHATSNIYLPDGEVAALDAQTGKPLTNPDGTPRMEFTYAELDPQASVELDSATLDEAVKNGYAVPGYVPGSGAKLSLPVHAAAQLVHYNQGMNNFRSLAGEINSTLGLKGEAALDAEAIVAAHPQLGLAVGQLASHWDGQPSTLGKALESMQQPSKDGKPNPQAAAARTIATAIGGDRLDEFTEKLANHKAAANEAAKESAREPFVEGRENRNAARAEARDDRRAHAKDDQLVIAGEPGKPETQVMPKGQLPQGWIQYPLKDPQQLAATVARFNDVQTKVNDLADFIAQGGMQHIQPGLVGDAIAEVNKDFKVGMLGTELPTARLNALLDQENYKAMNQASREFVRNYGFAREAMTQLPAIQTFGKSNRLNETQLKAALQLLPDHRMAGNSPAAGDQMRALQGILDPLRKSMPSGLPGAVLLPSFLERGAGAPGGQGNARPGTTGAPGAKGSDRGTSDPFAQFGGKQRATSPASE